MMQRKHQRKRTQSLDISFVNDGYAFSPPDKLEIFFQLFFGGMTLNSIPSENGSKLSTSSNSALPPIVIIYHVSLLVKEPHLVHLLESKGDDIEPVHKLF